MQRVRAQVSARLRTAAGGGRARSPGIYPDPGLGPRRREVRMRESLAEVVRPREGRVWRLARASHLPGDFSSLGQSG